jgi:hypothetical protein
MTDPIQTVRSRRALLVAAAGGAAALAASAALPLGVAAHDAEDVQLGVDNPTTAPTSITNATTDSNAFGSAATGLGFGAEATSTAGAGLYGWSVNARSDITPADLANTGVYGFAPAFADTSSFGAGVWGDSEDVGVFGTGNVGTWGQGNGIGNVGVFAEGETAIAAFGKIHFSRAGKATVAKHKSSVKVTLAGATASTKIFAVLQTNRTSRYVRAAVPHTGYFYIYLNASVSATTYVSWFVLD